MSENLLKTILRLLVIVAKEDEVTEDERKSVVDFLEENVSKEESARYMDFFDKLVDQTETGDEKDEKKEIIRLSYSVNKELKQEQKLVVLLRLLELIVADEMISEREKDLLYIIGNSLNFTTNIVDHLKSFVQADRPEKFAPKSSLIVTDAEVSGIKANHLRVDHLHGGFLAFFNAPGIDIYFVKYLGADALSLNGQSLPPRKIKIFSNGSSIRGLSAVTTPVYFSDVISGFHEHAQTHQLSFIAEEVSFRFKNGNLGLVNFNLSEKNGKLIGIMGGSGSGKSTLLNVLNGNEKPSEGSVRINNIDIHKESKKAEGIVGYVPQDDLLIEDLTVHQNLFYAAKLCFRHSTDEELHQLVDKVLLALGLQDTRDLKVGNPLQKTISGGQRKRLNIGLELLREPSVMFVDEPTSGLSSRDSENIMDLLKELSLKGKMIFVVIHQPSSDIFKMFDKLIILDVGGYQIYYGNPVDAVTYFKTIVDHVDKEQSACFNCGNVNPEQIFNIIETKVVDEYGRFTPKRKFKPKQWNKYFKENQQIEKVQDVNETPPKSLEVPSRLKQLVVFTTRDFLSKLSNRQYLIINLLEAPLLAFLLAFIVRYSPPIGDYSFKENINIPVFFFISVIVALFMGLTVSAEEIIKDRMILKRESFLHLSRLSYLLSKVLLLFTLSAVQTLLFTLIGVWILEIKAMTFSYWMVLFSVSCFANLLGLNISAAFNSVVTIYILIPLLIIPQLILSGVVVSFDKLNTTLSTTDKVPLIGEVMASRWAFEALAVAQFKDNPHNKPLYSFNRKIRQAEFKSVSYIPKLMDLVEASVQAKAESKEEELRTALRLLRIEVEKELKVVGADQFNLDRLEGENFDDQVAEDLTRFLETLRKFYNNRRKNAERDKNVFLVDYKSSQEEFESRESRYENDRINVLLRNTSVKEKVAVSNAGLVQKVYPIYARVESPAHPLDFRTVFYYPEKYIFGSYIPTPLFNIAMIWLMSVLLMITLYFDVLRKLINGTGR